MPAPASSAPPPPLSVPGLRDVASHFAETLPPPAARDTIPPSAPPATIPGARLAASVFTETLVPPSPAEDAGDTVPPVSGDAVSLGRGRPAKSA